MTRASVNKVLEMIEILDQHSSFEGYEQTIYDELFELLTILKEEEDANLSSYH